jgi:hypothetical protein
MRRGGARFVQALVKDRFSGSEVALPLRFVGVDHHSHRVRITLEDARIPHTCFSISGSEARESGDFAT